MDGMTIGYVAERNARKWPDEEAVVERGDDGRRATYTFAEFDARATRLANGLAARDVGRGDAVALYMHNNAETLEAFVGIMKLGALPVPVNHRFERDEVAYVLADSEVRACLIDEFGAETMAEIHDDPATPVECYLHVGEATPSFAEDYDAFRSGASAEPVDVDVSRLDEAGIMYTSGTTGRPKGCVYTHDNLVQLVQDAAYEWDHLEPGNRHLITTPLFHVGAFVPFLNTFHTAGTTIVVAGFDPEQTLAVIEAESVNSTYLVPTQSRMLLEQDVEAYDVSSLVEYTTGAAPVGMSLKRALMDRLDCEVTETFGQTEALSLQLPADVAAERPESVGRPTLNLEVAVLDPDTREPLDSGEVGLIAYRGPTVFKEYHNMPERTAEAFTEDGWFVSGDLVTVDEDGYVSFVGRSDDMIVTGGENVHPAEVEEVLQDHPDVDEVAVVGAPDDTWGERVTACVVPTLGGSPTEDELIDHVAGRLADFKRPRDVIVYDELPRNPTGKVLRGELP